MFASAPDSLCSQLESKLPAIIEQASAVADSMTGVKEYKHDIEQFRLELRESLQRNREEFEREHQEELWLMSARMDLLDCKLLELKGRARQWKN
jgi:uncharacterized short protein YbdD (DUF466 family)